MCSCSTKVTDRQTDRQTDKIDDMQSQYRTLFTAQWRSKKGVIFRIENWIKLKITAFQMNENLIEIKMKSGQLKNEIFKG